jgi:hypothetical protein
MVLKNIPNRRNAIVVFVITAVTVASATACNTKPMPRTLQSLLNAEQHWANVLDAGDARALSCILGDEFSDSTAEGGLRDRAQATEAVSQRRPLRQDLQELKAEILGETGIVHGVNHLSNAAGQEVARVRFTDVFVYRQGRRQAISAQETLVREAASSKR